MANRDVNLIIRAKNQASKSLDQVSDALKTLKGTQEGLASSASKVDGAISGLGDELDRLKAKAGAFAALDKAKTIMDTAAGAVARLKQELAGTEERLKAIGGESQAAAARLTELERASAEIAARLKTEKTTLDVAKQATLQKAAAMRELAAAEKAYKAAQAVPAGQANRDDGIAATKARLDAARAAVEKNAKAYADLQAQVAKTKTELSQISGEIRSARAAQRAFVADIDKTTSALADQKGNLDQAEAEYAQIEASVREAATALNVFDREQADTSATTAKLIPEIERLGTVMQALMRYSTGTGQFVDPKTAVRMQELRTQADAAKASWQALQEEAARLGAQMRSTSGNITELAEKQKSVIAASRAAKTEYQALAAQMNRISGAANMLPPMFSKVSTETTRTSASQKKLRQDIDETTKAMERQRAAAAKGILDNFNRESRQAMSVFQRLRGEVLSLATAYVGLYGTISNVGGVLQAYQKMEAAQNRLGVVFEQNQQSTNRELQFLQAQAARLGIEFGTLADQYSKFAVAAQAANFSTEETRKVFLSVAEAGRVNKLSLEDMNGVFLALTQMISKGKISSEELRQQLGERLPGAMNIMADALGVTSAALYKMLEDGEVLANSDNLLKFADELNRRFGPQLSKALQSTTTQLGKFFNNIFQAQLQVANGGFIDAFNSLLETLNQRLQSREGRDFFLALGAAAGKAVKGLEYLVENAEFFADVIQLIIGLKLASWLNRAAQNIQVMVANLGAAATATQTLGARQQVVVAQTTAFGAALRTAGASAVSLATQLFTVQGRAQLLSTTMLTAGNLVTTFSARTLAARASSLAIAGALGVWRGALALLNGALVALGGPVGILITLASLLAVPLLTSWASDVDQTTRALDEHNRIMSAVLEQYDQVKEKTGEWGEAVKAVSLDQANANVREMLANYEQLRDAAARAASNTSAVSFSWFGGFDGEARAFTKALQELGAQLSSGEITAREYRTELEKLYDDALKKGNTEVQKYVENLLEGARALEDQADATAIAANIAEGFGSKIELLAEALGLSDERLKDVAEATEETTDKFEEGATATVSYADALDKLKGFVPSLREEMEKLKKTTELNAAAWSALIAAWESGDYTKILEVMKLWGQGFSQINMPPDGGTGGFGTYSDSMEASSALIRQFEGFISTPKWDVNAFRAGYGSDTVTLSDGSIKAITEGMRISVEDAERDLQRLIGEFQNTVRGQIGDDRFAAFSADQQAVLTSIAYNYGSLPDRIVEAVLNGTDSDIAAAIRGLGSDNNGINRNRRNQEAAIFGRAPDGDAASETITKEREAALEAEEKITEERRKQQEATTKALADLGFENEMLQQKMEGKEREAFIEEQIRALREQNPAITEAEIARARELLGKQYDLNEALKEQKDKKSEIEQIEERINLLEQQRNALLEQRRIYDEQGNTEKVKELEAQIAGVNTQLADSIAKANELYATMGGEKAAAAIAQNNALALSVQGVGNAAQQAAYTQQQVQESIFNMLDSGIINMFDAFAQAIANGEDAVGALGDAFRQFAANFLMEIAKMIIKQALFNTLQQISKSLTGGLFGAGLLHTGGVVGASGVGVGSRNVSPAWFSGAMRYHSGGIAGLKPNEVPAILKAGEEVLTERDPRHIKNGGGMAQGGGRAKIVNMFDAASFLHESLNQALGEETILNYVRANPSAFKQAMEG